MNDPDYCYPPTFTVLRNKLGIRDARTLETAERQFVTQRLLDAVPEGDFDLTHLRAIHRHLFQDIFDWAGELRTVEMAKGSSRFQPRRFIETGMADIHRRIVAAGYFRGLEPDAFAVSAGSTSRGCKPCPSVPRRQWAHATPISETTCRTRGARIGPQEA